jgi:hypothetical protein
VGISEGSFLPWELAGKVAGEMQLFVTRDARCLDLFEMGGVHDKDSSPVLAGFGGTARVSKDVEDGLHVLLLHADEECNVAPAQETTGAGNASHTMVLSYQLLYHRPGVYVTDDGDDKFH